MPTELFWLTATVAMTGLLWIPYILDRMLVRGIAGTLANPSPNAKPQSPWAMRLYFAHTNAVENLIVFAPLVLIAQFLDISSRTTALACVIYFWARLAHAIIFTLGIPGLRTLAFLAGFAAQVMLAIEIFRAM